MCSCLPSSRARSQAESVLCSLTLLVRALHDGGQVSALHLTAVGETVLDLLEELDGFEDVVRRYSPRPADPS